MNADLVPQPRRLQRPVCNSEQKALEVAANASLSKSLSYRIYSKTVKALKDLTENHGVHFSTTHLPITLPSIWQQPRSLLEEASAENEFFAEVWQSQKDFRRCGCAVLGGCTGVKCQLRAKRMQTR